MSVFLGRVSTAGEERLFEYSDHDCWTWYSDIGGRRSSVAESASKQSRQCSVVAMTAECDDCE